MDAEPPEEHYSPLALLGVILIALLGFAVFFLSFLVAPLAILLIFYVGFAASDRSKRNKAQARSAQESDAPGADPSQARAQTLSREAQYRRQSLDRATLDASRDPAEPR